MRPARPEDARRAAHPDDGPRAGFALPLALFALVVLSLMIGLILDGALEELRASRGDVALTEAQAAAESAVADLLATPADTDFLALPRGTLRESVTAGGRDTVRVSVQALGGGLARVVTAARSWSAGVRADANTLVLLRVLADTGAPSHPLKYRRILGWWWAQIP